MESYDALKQIVPSALCLACDVCCRFPEEESFLRPFFTTGEIAQLAPGERHRFPNERGSRIRLEPHGEGCICPYFDPATHFCKIYSDRPLDCRIYPFALLRDEKGEVALGIDPLCPYIQEHARDPQMAEEAEGVARFLESEPICTLIAQHPSLIGPFQGQVIVLRLLDKVTRRLAGAG